MDGRVDDLVGPPVLGRGLADLLPSQVTPSESSELQQRACETQAMNLLRDHHGFKEMVRVTLHESLLNRQYAVITMRKPNGLETWNATATCASSTAAPAVQPGA